MLNFYSASRFSGRLEMLFQHGLLFLWFQTMIGMMTLCFPACRLHTAQRAIKQTQVTVQKIGREIEEKLRTTAACTERVRTVTHRPVTAYLLIPRRHSLCYSVPNET